MGFCSGSFMADSFPSLSRCKTLKRKSLHARHFYPLRKSPFGVSSFLCGSFQYALPLLCLDAIFFLFSPLPLESHKKPSSVLTLPYEIMLSRPFKAFDCFSYRSSSILHIFYMCSHIFSSPQLHLKMF